MLKIRTLDQWAEVTTIDARYITVRESEHRSYRLTHDTAEYIHMAIADGYTVIVGNDRKLAKGIAFLGTYQIIQIAQSHGKMTSKQKGHTVWAVKPLLISSAKPSVDSVTLPEPPPC